MKFKVETNSEPFKKFPLLARTKDPAYGRVTLFLSKNKGFDIKNEQSPDKIGEYSTTYVDVFNSEVWEILPKGTKVTLIQE